MLWELRKLGAEVINIGTGRSSFTSGVEKSNETPFPVLGSTSIISYDSEFDHLGDFVLTARVGANAGNLYKYAGNVKISDNTVYIQSNNLNFIFYLLTKFDVKKLSFGTGQPLVKASELKNLSLHFPIDDEQQKIGSLFQQLDNTITLHQRKLDKLKRLKQGYLQQLFSKNDEKVPRVRFTNFNDEWPQCKLGKLGNTFTGLSGKTKEDFGHGEAKFVTYVNVFGNPISDPNGTERVEIDNKQNQVKFGDVFFTTSSETPEEVGMSSIWLENTKNVYLNSFCFGYHPTAELDPYYLAFMLRSPVIRKQFMFLAQGISRYNISKTKVMEMEVPVPNIEEQQKVGLFFKQLDDIITVHQSKIGKLKLLKQSLLQKMFI